jgi:hypothetical protein
MSVCGLLISFFHLLRRRVLGNRLDLVEQSLVHKLNANAKHIYFNNSTITPSSLSIHRHDNSVHVLLSTKIKLYRFVLPIRAHVSTRRTSLAYISDANPMQYLKGPGEQHIFVAQRGYSVRKRRQLVRNQFAACQVL